MFGVPVHVWGNEVGDALDISLNARGFLHERLEPQFLHVLVDTVHEERVLDGMKGDSTLDCLAGVELRGREDLVIVGPE